MQSPLVSAYFALVDAYAAQTGLDLDTAERELADRAEAVEFVRICDADGRPIRSI